MKKTISFSDNSLDLLRLFAALQIAVTHYLNLTMLNYGKAKPEDAVLYSLKRFLTLFPGLIILLTISGFLMGEVLLRTESRRAFVRKRVFRIYPGLWCCLLFILIEINLLLGKSNISWIEMFSWLAIQGVGIAYTPSFLHNFATGSLNGTLWAIMVELQLYFLIFLFWKRILKWSRLQWNIGLLIAFGLNMTCWAADSMAPFPERIQKIIQRSFLPYLLWFYLGLYLWKFRAELLSTLSKYWMLLLAGYVGYKICWQHFEWSVPGYYSDIVTSICLPVVVLACAYGWGKHRLSADLSYGIFLYHWPLINLIFYQNLPEHHNHVFLFVLYLIGFLVLAGLSWFGLERRCLHISKEKNG